MATGNEYDADIQMFVHRPREIDLAHLRFLRWLAVRGCLEHEPAGRPYGVYALGQILLTQSEQVRRDAAPAQPECCE